MPEIKKDKDVLVDTILSPDNKKSVEPVDNNDQLVDTVEPAKMVNLYSPEKEGQTFLSAAPESNKKDKTVFEINPQDALQAVVDSEILTKENKEGKGITPYEAYHYRDLIDKGIKINPIMASKRSTLLQRVQQVYKAGKQTVEAGHIGYQYIITGDPKHLKELDKMHPLTEDQRFIPESSAEKWALNATQILPPMLEGGKQSLAYGMLGAGTAGTGAIAFGQPELAPEAAAVGFRAGALSGILTSSFELEAGNLFNEMYHYKGKDGKGINLNVARATSSVYGVVASALETTQMMTLIKTVPGLGEVLTGCITKTLASRTVKNKLLNIALDYTKDVATETGTEVLQEAAGILFSEIGKAISNSKFGTMIDHSTWKQKWDRLTQTAIQSLQGFSVLLLPGAALKGTGHILTGNKETIQESSSQERSVTEETTNKEQETKTPVSEEKNIDIEESIHKNFEKLVNLEDKDLDKELDNIIDKLQENELPENKDLGPRTLSFKADVEQVVGKEKASPVIAIIQARAEATGMTSDEYLEYHDLSIEPGNLEDIGLKETQTQNGSPKAAVVFQDTKTIIKAFSKADVSSVVHELGHIFRRDLGGEDLKIASDWAGAHGGIWSREAEEKFARGFEKYLASGEAPTPKMKIVFEKFKHWMAEIYHGVKNSSIDLQISPEMKQVYDRLLMTDKKAGTDELFQTHELPTEFQKSYEKTKAYFKGSDQWLKAPNGKPTLLNEKLWILTRTPEFRKWFGKSQVVDVNGDPLVVYHGTNKSFAEFKTGKQQTDQGWMGADLFYFTDYPEIAGDYANQVSFIESSKGIHQEGGQVYPVFLKAENLFEFTADQDFAETPEEAQTLTKKLKDKGYDGVYLPYEEQADFQLDKPDSMFKEIAVIKSEQIKSAIGNKGTFTESPNILLQKEELETPAFKKFFKGSKIVDKDGNPLPVYHGTDADVTEFLEWRPNFFSPDIAYTEGYGKKTMAAYLSIKHPLDTATDEKARKIYNEDFVKYIKDKGRKLKVEKLKKGEAVPFTTADQFWAFMRAQDRRGKLGYDGLIVDEAYFDTPNAIVPLYNTQIKSIENQGTWDKTNPNIYLQEADIESPAFKDFFEGSKIVDENNNPLVVAHGTNVSGIEIFKNSKNGQAGEGSYFTPYESEAKQYGNEVMLVYLSIKNPWVVARKDIPLNTKGLKTTLESQGYDGIVIKNSDTPGMQDADEIISFYPGQIKSATKNAGTFDRYNDNIYYQKEDKKSLIAYHNTNEQGLLKAIESGGLAVPSIAITKKDVPYSNFGTITLIGNKDLIDPTQQENKIYESDVYSIRTPRIKNDLKLKESQKLYRTLIESFKKAGTYSTGWGNSDKEVLQATAKNNLGWKLAYLDQHEIKLRIPKKNVPLSQDILRTESFTAFAKQVKGLDKNKPLTVQQQEQLSKAVTESIKDYFSDKPDERIKTRVMNMYFNHMFTDGKLNFNQLDKIIDDIDKIKHPKKITDTEKLHERVSKKFTKKRTADFHKWVNESVDNIFSDPYILKGKKKIPATLQNLVDVMLQKKTKGSEATLTYPVAKARGEGAKELKSFKSMHGKESNIIAAEKVQDYISTFQDPATEKYHSEICEFSKYPDSMSVYDDSMRVIGKYLQGKPTPERMAQALRMYDFDNVPEWAVSSAMDYAEIVRNTPTQYFEGKLRRAVSLQEFSGAVIPKTSSKDLKIKLKSEGIPYRLYDSEQEGSREKAIASFHKKKGVLFQKAEKNKLTPEEQAYVDLITTHYTEDQLTGYTPELLEEYSNKVEKAAVKAVKDLEKEYEKEDKIALRSFKKEAKEILESSGPFHEWEETVKDGGLNLQNAYDSAGKNVIRDLMKRRPGLFRRDSENFSDVVSNILGYDTADEMFQAWHEAGSKRDAIDRIANDMMREYEWSTEKGREEDEQKRISDYTDKELNNLYLKKKPVNKKLKGIIRRNTGQVHDDEKTITDRVALREALRREALGARHAYSVGNKEGVLKARQRFNELLKRASIRRKTSADIKKIKAQIKRELKFAGVKKINGKPAGKFTPEIQDVLDKLIEAHKLTPAEAEARIAENLEKYSDKIMPDDVLLENHMLEMVARLDTMKSPEQLQGLLDEIKALKNEGKLINWLKAFNKSNKNKVRIDNTVEILGGVPEDIKYKGIKDYAPDTIRQKAMQALKTLGKTLMGWDDLMDILSKKDKDSKPGESFISKDNDLLSVKNKEKQGLRLSMDKINGLYKKAFRLKTNRQVLKQMQTDNTKIIKFNHVSMTDPETQTNFHIDLKFTRAELRKRCMELQDPSLEETFRNMGYNEGTKATLHEALTVQDKLFIKQQMDFYNKYYEGTNAVYKEMYGVNLPKNNFYSPLSREGVAKPVEDSMGEFVKEMAFRASAATAGALKSRTENVLTLAKQSDLSVLERHISEMEHFKAYAEKIRDLNTVWKNPKVRAAVEINHGRHMLSLLDGFISDIANNGNIKAFRLGWLDGVRTRLTKAVIAMGVDKTLKQLMSFPAYAEKMPVSTFTKNLILFWKNPIENAKELYEASELLKSRGGNMERDIKDAMHSAEFTAFSKTQTFTNILMLNVKAGDQGAIVFGGWAYYKYLRDSGLSKEDAVYKFEKFTEQTQQSGDITEQSYFQRAGSIGKLFTMFRSSPNQYLRKEIGAVRNLLAGRMTKSQAAKTLLIYHIMLPMLFQFASDRFTWDEDEQKRALLFGSLNGWFIIGDALDFLLRASLGMQTYDMEVPILSTTHDLLKAKDLIHFLDLSAEEFLKAIRGLASVGGKVTGLPLKTGVDMATGVNDVLSGKYEKGISEVLGYTPKTAEKAAKR